MCENQGLEYFISKNCAQKKSDEKCKKIDSMEFGF